MQIASSVAQSSEHVSWAVVMLVVEGWGGRGAGAVGQSPVLGKCKWWFCGWDGWCRCHVRRGWCTSDHAIYLMRCRAYPHPYPVMQLERMLSMVPFLCRMWSWWEVVQERSSLLCTPKNLVLLTLPIAAPPMVSGRLLVVASLVVENNPLSLANIQQEVGFHAPQGQEGHLFPVVTLIILGDEPHQSCTICKLSFFFFV